MLLRRLRVHGLALGFLAALALPALAATRTMNTSGDMTLAANYQGGIAPGPLDDVTIDEGVAATLDVDFGINSLTLVGGGSLAGASLTINSTAILTVGGSDVGGNAVTIGPGGAGGPTQINVLDGQILATAGDFIIVGGGSTNSRLLADAATINTANVDLQAAGAVIDFTGGNPALNVTGNLAVGGSLTGGASVITVSGNVSGAGTILGNTSNLKIGGSFTHSGTFTPNTSTFTYEGSGSSNVRATPYHHLVFNQSGSRFILGFTALSGNLTVGDNAFVFLGNQTISTLGDATVNGVLNDATGTLQMNGAGRTLGGDGLFQATILFNQSTNIASTATLETLGSVTISSTATVTNNGIMKIGSSIFGQGPGSTWVNAANSEVSVFSDLLTTGVLTATAVPNKVVYNGTGNQTVKTTTYHHLTLTTTGVTTTKFTSAAIAINGNLLVTGDTVVTPGGGMTIAGNATVTGTNFNADGHSYVVNGNWVRSGSFTPGTSLFTFSGLSPQAISSTDFYRVTFDNAGVKTLGGSITAADDFTITNDAAVAGGEFNHTIGGDWIQAAGGVFTPGSTAASTVTFNGTGTQFVDATTFRNMTVNKTALDVRLNGNVGVLGNLTLTDGDFDLVTSSLDVDGNTVLASLTLLFLNDGTASFAGHLDTDGLLDADTGTVVIDGIGIQTWTGLVTPTLHNLTINKASASLNASVDLNIDGFFTLTSGVLVTASTTAVNVTEGTNISRTGGWVDGRLNVAHLAAGAKFYPLGTSSGYAPLTVTTAGGGQLDIEIVDATHPLATGANVLPFYWNAHPTTTVGPPVSLDFAYPNASVVGTETAYVIGFHDGTSWAQPGGTVDDVNDTASISGVSSFEGGWTLGEASAVGGVAAYEVTGAGSTTAGVPHALTITAKDSGGVTVTSYTGTYALQFSGANSSPDATAPTAEDNTAAQVPFGTNTSIDFVNGVATVNVLLYEAGSPTIVATEQPSGVFGDLLVSVSPAAASELSVSDVNGSQPLYANGPFTLAITAVDGYGNPSDVVANTDIQLSLVNCTGCTGTPGGTLTLQIPSANTTANFGGLTYSVAEGNVVITASAIAGDTLTSIDSAPLTFATPAAGYTVTNANDSGAGSLRDAINTANSGACGGALPCNITFDILPPGAKTFQLTSRLPAIDVPVVIDGNTQDGYAGTPLLTIDDSLVSLSIAFELNGDGSTLRGFKLAKLTSSAVELNGNGSVVQNCWIGLDATGTAAAGNATGIKITGTGNLVGGSAAGQRNVISGNNTGIRIQGSTNTVAGNYIGTGVSGTLAVANGQGVRVEGTVTNNVIGGSAAARNVISGNTGNGINLQSNAIIVVDGQGRFGSPATTASNITNTVISGNYIGVAVDGLTALGNATGVSIGADSTGNHVGSGGVGNVISGNGTGVEIVAATASGNFVRSNLIGVGFNGTTPVPNTTAAIVVNDGANNTIGGTGASDGNLIANNGGDGVVVSGAANATAILGNSIPSFAALAIDLNADGADVQDAGDADGGSNGKQNFTSISSAAKNGANLDALVSIDSSGTGAGSFRVELFEASGTGGPATYLGSGCLAGNSLTNALVSVPAGGATTGDSIVSTATAYTDAACSAIGHGTSEVSAAAIVVCPPPPVTITGPATVCPSTPVTLDAGAGFSSYLWSTGAITQTITFTPTGTTTVSVTVTNGSGCSNSDTHTVTLLTPTPVTITGPATACDSATLDAGAGFASYLWSTGATSQTISVTTGGTYSVTTTGGNGCSATDSHAISISTTPGNTVTPSGPTTFCAGGSVTLTASNATSWLWSNGQTTQSIVVTAAGSYSVQASNGSCTSTSAPVTVTVNPAPVVTITGPASFCAGSSITLDAGPGSSWLWSTGATTQTISVTTPGSYSVTLTDGTGCSGSDSHSVAEDPAPVVNITGPASFCAGDTITLDAGAGFASYLWSTGSTSQTISVSTAGTYSVSVTDGTGCNGTATHAVTENTPPVASITGATSMCPGGSVTLDAGPGFASYLWSTSETTQTIVVSPASTQTYTATVTDGNGCDATDSHAVTVAAAFTFAITGPTQMCAGDTITLDAGAGFTSYLWSTGATTRTISVSPAISQSYSVTVSNGSCSGSDSHNVTVDPLPVAAITPGGPTTFCSGGSVTLTAAPATSYLWSTGAITQSIVVTTTGAYSVTVTNAAGCAATSAPTNVTVNATPAVTITGPAATCDGTAITLDAGAGFTSYLWSTGATTQTISVAPSADTTYSVNVVDGNGCPGSDSHLVSVSANPVATIAAPASVCAGSAGNEASVASQAGASYNWSITGGTITGGQGTPVVEFKAGGSGSVALNITVTTGSCTSTGSVSIPVAAIPVVEITAPSSADPGDVLTASVVSEAGVSYGWTIINGTLLTGGTTSAITFQADDPGQLKVIVNATRGGCSSSDLHVVDVAGSEPQNADIFLTKTATTSVRPGAPIAYTLTVRNLGPLPASTVTVVDSLPQGTTFVTLAGGSFQCQNASGVITCNGPLAAGANNVITINVNAPPSAGVVTNNASVSSEVADTKFSNNSAAATTIVKGGPVDCRQVAPVLTAPGAGGETGTLVTFSWTAVPNAIGYTLWAEVNGTSVQDLGTTNGAITLTTIVPAGTSVVYVDALFNGCEPTRSPSVAFRATPPEECGDRTKAVPIAPANGAVLGSSEVVFRWNPANEPDGYRVWFSRNGATPEVVGTTLDETSFAAGLQAGAYEWWVESLYDGCASTESDHRTCTIPQRSGCSTLAPALLEPAASSHLTNALVTFQWTPVPDALRYEVWVSIDRGTPTLMGESETSSLTTAIAEGELDWFVRAIVDRCPTVQSGINSFLLETPESCRGNRRPVPLAPVSRTHASSPVDFSWVASPGASGYEVFVRRGNGAPVLIGSTTATHLDDVTLNPGNLRWFVRALFPGCIPLDSAEEKLEVVPAVAACGTLPTPQISAVAQVSSDVPFLIQWTEAPGATAYRLQIADNPQFANPETFTTLQAFFELTRTNEGAEAKPLFARVRALDGRCTPLELTPYGLTAAIWVLPHAGVEGATPARNGLVEHTIALGPELAGNAFTVTVTEEWLTASPASGVVAPGGTSIVITADSTSLPFGASLGSVVVTLTSDSAGRISTHAASIVKPTVSISKISPVSPTPKSTPPPDALIIPAVAHADGINSKFQSDVRVTNSSAKLMNYQLTFIPSGDAGITTGRQSNFSIEPGRTVALDDVLRTWFGTGNESVTGTLEIRPLTQTASATSNASFAGIANLVTFASSRTFNITANGSFGQHVPAVPYANFVGNNVLPGAAAKILSLQQIAQSDRYRTNLGIVEGSGEAVSLLVKVFGDNGQALTQFPVNLAGGQHLQLNSFLSQHGISSLHDGRVEIAVTSALGKITAYASVLDNATSDPLLVTPVALSDVGDDKWVIPGVADLNTGGANWRTDMRIFNAGTSDVETTLAFHSQNGGAPKTTTMTIPAGQVRQLDGTLASVFNTTNDGGAVHLTTPGTSRLIATARTYNLTTGGTYGQFISGVTAEEAAGVGSRPLQILQVEETSRFRTNIGVAEVTGQPVTVEIAVMPPDAKFAAITEVTLQGNEFRQLNQILRSVGLADTFNARVTVKAISGSGRVTAYASVIDSLTNDPTYVPAQ